MASTRKTKIERSLEPEAIRRMKDAFENDIIIVVLELLEERRFGSGMVFLRYRARHGIATCHNVQPVDVLTNCQAIMELPAGGKRKLLGAIQLVRSTHTPQRPSRPLHWRHTRTVWQP